MKNYKTNHAEKYQNPERIGYTNISILQFLNGHKWDEVALAYLHSVRPSAIRVVYKNEAVTCDSYVWRVTVVLNDQEEIESITQEVAVGLPEGVAHGQALGVALEKGIDSDECQKFLKEPQTIYNSEALKRIQFSELIDGE